MIKAFIFDLGNVIVSFDHRKIVQRLEDACGLPGDDIFYMAVASPLVQEYNLGKITSQEFIDQLNRELDLKLEFADFFQIWNCTFAPEPIVPERIIRSLSEKYRLLILSDTNEMHFDFIREKYSILDYFDDFVLSHKVRAAKPSPEIFRHAVEKAGCRPEECFFLDDLEANVEGAKRVGLNALQFVSAAQLEVELKERDLI